MHDCADVFTGGASGVVYVRDLRMRACRRFAQMIAMGRRGSDGHRNFAKISDLIGAVKQC